MKELQAFREVDEVVLDNLASAFEDAGVIVHKDNVTKGFWDTRRQGWRGWLDRLAERLGVPVLRERNAAETIALMHSELSEALEAVRHGNPKSEHIPDFTGAEEELADAVIRIMDTARARGWRVGPAIVAKVKFNRTRPYRHGKRF